VKKVLTWGALIFVAFYLVTEPTSAAHLLTSAFDGLRDIGNSLASFVHSLSL
jgi:hypothetical protein